mgnify:CR=1 FL=1
MRRVTRGSLEFRREVSRVHRVSVRVHAWRRVRHVIHDEPDVVRNRPRNHVGRRHAHAPFREGGRHVGSRADSDLDHSLEVGENGGEFGVQVAHVGTFMAAASIAVAMRVDIVPVGEVSAAVKREASSGLRAIYDCEVSVTAEQPLPAGAYDDTRGQYRASDFIDVASRAGSGDKTVALTPKDLYYRRRNYVFGLAYLDGRGCVVSTYRLQTSSDGGFSERSSEQVFSDRVRKEVVHELGHTLGLEHCDNNRCAMSFSPTVQEVDRKEQTLCGTCQRKVF